jgi:hypothetical protein
MTDIVALIVGIETYARTGWQVPGPCRNAVQVAKYLVDKGVKPERIFLFTNEYLEEGRQSAIEPQLAELKRAGVKPGVPIREEIDTCFKRLPLDTVNNRERPNGSRLFCYWSGHGYTKRGDRVFLCADYTTAGFTDRVFDATNRLLRLRSERFRCFSQQIFIADVCGQYANVELGNDKQEAEGLDDSIRQEIFFATLEGGYSTGAFSTIALEVLKGLQLWPALTEFSARLWRALEAADLEPHLISSYGKGREIENKPVGRPRGEGLLHEVYALLSAIPEFAARARAHYDATADDLAPRETHDIVGLWQMILDLGERKDGAPGRMSYGLLQFLVRISRDPAAGPVVAQWLGRNLQPDQQYDLSRVKEVLVAEQEKKVLVLELDHDAACEPNRFTWFVCSRSSSLTSSAQSMPQEVHNWKDLSDKIGPILDEMERGDESIAEVHFVVEPALFDRDFHRIPRDPTQPDGPCLGEQYVVLLRDSRRVYQKRGSLLRKSWEERAAALRGIPAKDVKRIRIPPERTNLVRLFDAGEGLCYTGFVFGCPSDALRKERQVMEMLARMGVPYLYWLQRGPPGDWATELDSRLKLWLDNCDHLTDFPERLQRNRAGGDELACYGALLWDDPRFLPFLRLASPTKG